MDKDSKQVLAIRRDWKEDDFAYFKLMGRQNTNDMRVGPGQGVPIEENGQMSIKDMIMGLPFHDVTPGLMSMVAAGAASGRHC